jgi:hypothetical protein
MCRVDKNNRNKQSRTSEKEWTFILGAGRRTSDPQLYKLGTLRNVTQGLGLRRTHVCHEKAISGLEHATRA